MDCKLIQADLVAYHFGSGGDDARDEVDAHLLGCNACLRTYLGIKRHVDHGASLDARPRASVRARLRADVLAEFRPTASARLRRIVSRPIPLYKGLALAAVLVACAVLAPLLRPLLAAKQEPRSAILMESARRIDTSSPKAESLTFY